MKLGKLIRHLGDYLGSAEKGGGDKDHETVEKSQACISFPQRCDW
jgi:hypothetical protein